MNKFTYSVLGLLVWICLMHCQIGQSDTAQQLKLNTTSIANNQETLRSYPNIKIINEGPTGSKFTNSKRGEFGLLVFRIQMVNDTIVPIDLELEFPSTPVPLLPDSITKVEVYVLPDSITPDTIQNNAANFGVRGLADYFNSDFTDPGSLKIRIEPKEHHTLYLGMIAESKMGHGTFRTKLFINGQDIDAPFLPIRSIKTEKTDNRSLDLVYGIGFTPHKQYTLIPCGHINFLK